MTFTELRDLPLPSTSVADGVWAKARARRRRRAAVGVTSVVIVACAVSITIGTLGGGTRTEQPGPTPAPASDVPTQTAPTVTDLPDYAALAASVPDMTAQDATPLSANPVKRALLAAAPRRGDDPDALTVVNVLGDDGQWRYLDVTGLVPPTDAGGNEGYALTPSSLSPDRTRLALPQPDRVVVIDLTTGDDRTFVVSGFNAGVQWQDDVHVVVTREETKTSTLVNVETGTITKSQFTANTGFGPDGSWVTWDRERNLVSSDGTQTYADVPNNSDPLPTTPLVDGDTVVGLGSHNLNEGDMTYVNLAGVAVVNRLDGALRGFVYTEGPDSGRLGRYLLGLDNNIVTFGVGVPPGAESMLIVRWSMLDGDVIPVAVLRAGMITGPLQ